MTPTLPQLPPSPGMKTPGGAEEGASPLIGQGKGESFDALIMQAAFLGHSKPKTPDQGAPLPANGEGKQQTNGVTTAIDVAMLLAGNFSMSATPVATTPVSKVACGGSAVPKGQVTVAVQQVGSGSQTVAASNGKISTAEEDKSDNGKSLLAAMGFQAVNGTSKANSGSKDAALTKANVAAPDMEAETAQHETSAAPDSKATFVSDSIETSGKNNSGADSPAKVELPDAGTSIAKMSAAVKKPEETIRIAGAAGKILPGGVMAVEAKNDLLAQSGNGSTNAVSAVQSGGDGERAMATDAVAAPADTGARTVERTQEMVVQHAMRLSSSNAESLQVVIRPDTGTQLSLELRQRGDGVEVQAVLQQGDFNQLNQNWSDLQHQLQQRGIQLGELTCGNESGGTGDAQMQQGQNGESRSLEEDAPVFATVGGMAPASGGLAVNVPPPVGVSGWQTWA